MHCFNYQFSKPNSFSFHFFYQKFLFLQYELKFSGLAVFFYWILIKVLFIFNFESFLETMRKSPTSIPGLLKATRGSPRSTEGASKENPGSTKEIPRPQDVQKSSQGFKKWDQEAPGSTPGPPKDTPRSILDRFWKPFWIQTFVIVYINYNFRDFIYKWNCITYNFQTHLYHL